MKRQEKLVSLFPLGLLLSMSKRRVLHLLSGLPEEERSFWKALLAEKISSYVTKAWLISQYKLLADYCASYHFAPADLERWPGAILILQADDDELIQRLAREPLTAFYPQAQVHTFHNANHLDYQKGRIHQRGKAILTRKATRLINTCLSMWITSYGSVGTTWPSS